MQHIRLLRQQLQHQPGEHTVPPKRIQIAHISTVPGRVEQGVSQNLVDGKAVIVDAAVPAPATGPRRRGAGFVQFVSERLL